MEDLEFNMVEQATVKILSPPGKGEKTKRQVLGIGDALGIITDIPGFSSAPGGNYNTYRKMRTNPTVALARAVATTPLRAASWSVVAEDEYDKEEVTSFIQKEIEVHWRGFIKNLLFALDYGWAPFEIVWDINQDGRWVYRKLKHLIVDKTKIIVKKDTGVFDGLQNISTVLPAKKCFLYSYDAEGGNLSGRSRHENIRSTAWVYWDQVMEKFGKYFTKISGIIPMVEYPEGESQDESGATIDNFTIAKKVLQQLGSGNGITMPNTLIRWAEDAVFKGVDVSKLKSWQISFIEAKGQHGNSYNTSLRYTDSLIMRGWLVPERTALEGQHGTKAESGTHGEIALQISDLLFDEILEYVNWYLVNPLLIYNMGPEWENRVWLEKADMNPLLRKLLSDMMGKILTEPMNMDLVSNWLDINAILDNLAIPKSTEKVEFPEREENNDDAKKVIDKVQDQLSRAIS